MICSGSQRTARAAAICTWQSPHAAVYIRLGRYMAEAPPALVANAWPAVDSTGRKGSDRSQAFPDERGVEARCSEFRDDSWRASGRGAKAVPGCDCWSQRVLLGERSGPPPAKSERHRCRSRSCPRGIPPPATARRPPSLCCGLWRVPGQDRGSKAAWHRLADGLARWPFAACHRAGDTSSWPESYQPPVPPGRSMVRLAQRLSSAKWPYRLRDLWTFA